MIIEHVQKATNNYSKGVYSYHDYSLDSLKQSAQGYVLVSTIAVQLSPMASITRHAPINLDEFTLKDVLISENELGCGSSGQVFELEYQGLKCAGKRVHQILNEVDYCVQGFLNECRLLSQIRHPNIVQFLGIVFEKGTQLPILVTEFLPTDLRSCLEHYGVLRDEISYSILHDVSLGLAFLHSQTPQIIHLDISSTGILLSANMTAKICDFGSAMIFEGKHQLMTLKPGCPPYMPPETLVDDPHYDASVDVFSFGALMVEMFTAKLPLPEIARARKDPAGILIVISEVERRQNLLNKIGDKHPLMDLITSCLNNNPDRRPKVFEFVNRLKGMVLQYHSGNKLDMLKEIDTLQAREIELEKDGGEAPLTGIDLHGPCTFVRRLSVPDNHL